MKAFYIAGTHWDREWYEPFQEYRFWLVQTIDAAMELLEDDPAFAVWHLDGQTILPEDYLEIRPEQRERLLGLINAGRMPAGPWYTMPDEWLVSGEALVRNLQVGMLRARKMGFEPARVGYAPDMFGHVSSLPMIFAGFGFRGAVVWRGVRDDWHGAQFVWAGPDGSQMLTHKLPDMGSYGWWYLHVRRRWQAEGHDPDALRKALAWVLPMEQQRLNAPVMWLGDAFDHDGADPRAPEVLDAAREQFPNVEFVWATMEDYFDGLSAYRDELPVGEGELRSTADGRHDGNWVIPQTLSSRYPLKLSNDRCQAMLTLWAEPLAAMAMLEDRPVPTGYLETAWAWLLKNQPHDSICGCSIDATHRDMGFRYDQALGLGDAVRRQAMAVLAEPSTHVRDAHRYVVVHNPLPWARSGVQQLELVLPPDFEPKAGLGMCHPPVAQFELLDTDGRALPYQVLEVRRRRAAKLPDALGRRRLPEPERADVYRVAVDIPLPAGGHTTVEVQPKDLDEGFVRNWGTLRTGPLLAANEHIAFALDSDGTARLTHLPTGRELSRLFCYEDSGDAGDGWCYVPPAVNETIVSPGHTVQCGVEHDGSRLVTFRVRRTLSVPESAGDPPRERRSDRRTDLVITDFLTLTATSPFLHVRTVIENTVRDHRVRVLLPTDIQTDSYVADQAFAVVGRPVARDPRSATWKEADPEERPHTSFFALEDEGGGLAVITPEGLHEHSVLEDERRTVCLTLLRGFRHTVRTDGEPGGQILGSHEFNYALLPYGGRLDRAGVLRTAAELQAGIYRHGTARARGTRSLIEAVGSQDIVVTSVKPAWDGSGIVIRLWNTGDKPARGGVRLDAGIAGACLCNLNEEPGQTIAVEGRETTIQVPARGLVSLRIVPA